MEPFTGRTMPFRDLYHFRTWPADPASPPDVRSSGVKQTRYAQPVLPGVTLNGHFDHRQWSRFAFADRQDMKSAEEPRPDKQAPNPKP